MHFVCGSNRDGMHLRERSFRALGVSAVNKT
jgi:hypothetical protein